MQRGPHRTNRSPRSAQRGVPSAHGTGTAVADDGAVGRQDSLTNDRRPQKVVVGRVPAVAAAGSSDGGLVASEEAPPRSRRS